jgi:hypothetical protein
LEDDQIATEVTQATAFHHALLAAVDRAKYDARASVSSFCSIDDKPVDCDKAKEFITDHMKN